MRIISKKRIINFYAIYRNSKKPLLSWYAIMEKTTFNSFTELKKTFPSADLVGKLIVFNIGGNKYRLISAIHFNTKMVFIRNILTHDEYNKNRWKED